MWGKGRYEMNWNIQEFYESVYDVDSIAIIIAGNDISWGSKAYQEYIIEIMQWSPTIYSAIPAYTSRQAECRGKSNGNEEEVKLSDMIKIDKKPSKVHQ